MGIGEKVALGEGLALGVDVSCGEDAKEQLAINITSSVPQKKTIRPSVRLFKDEYPLPDVIESQVIVLPAFCMAV